MCLSLCARPKLHSVHCLQSADVALLHVTDVCHINNTSRVIKFLHQWNIGKFHVYFFLLTNVYFLGSSTTTNDTTNHKEGSWMTGNSGPNDVTRHWAQVCFIFSCFFFSLIYIRSFNYYLRRNTTMGGPTQANEDQWRPTKPNKAQQRQRKPTKTKKGQRRPTQANKGQRKPTKTNEG